MASAADFYTLTPGSAVAGALQDILTRRKTEARQAMLDKMAQEEQSSVISDRAARQEQARQELELQKTQEARQKLLSEAQMREMEQQGLEREMGHLAKGVGESDITDPKLREYVQKSGGFQAQPESPDMPVVTGDVVQGASMRNVYAGTPKEQAEDAARQRVSDIVQQLQAETDPEKQRQLALSLMAEGVNIPGTLAERRVQPALVTAGGKKIPIPGALVPESDALHYLGYPPNYGGGGSQNVRTNYEITTKDGRMRVDSLTNDEAAKVKADPNTAGIVETGVKSLAQPGIGATDRKSLMDAKTMLDAARSSSTWFGMGGPDPKKLAVAESQYRSALSSVYGADPASPKIKDIATKIAMHPQLSQMSTQELVQSVKQLEGATDQDIRDLDRLLNYTRGNPEAIFAVQ